MKIFMIKTNDIKTETLHWYKNVADINFQYVYVKKSAYKSKNNSDIKSENRSQLNWYKKVYISTLMCFEPMNIWQKE